MEPRRLRGQAVDARGWDPTNHVSMPRPPHSWFPNLLGFCEITRSSVPTAQAMLDAVDLGAAAFCFGSWAFIQLSPFFHIGWAKATVRGTETTDPFPGQRILASWHLGGSNPAERKVSGSMRELALVASPPSTAKSAK